MAVVPNGAKRLPVAETASITIQTMRLAKSIPIDIGAIRFVAICRHAVIVHGVSVNETNPRMCEMS